MSNRTTDDDTFDVPACRICGCTDERACAGGCWWVEDPEGEGDLCSACLTEVIHTLGVRAGLRQAAGEVRRVAAAPTLDAAGELEALARALEAIANGVRATPPGEIDQ